jgi:hypothetical protein
MDQSSAKGFDIAATAASYLGSQRFQRRYRPVRESESLLGWRIIDVANKGDDSCAAFVSHVLRKNGLLARTRSTIGMMVQDMERRGWEQTTEQVVGGVALWGFREDVHPNEREFGHSGLYVGDEIFISHSSFEFVPVEHTEALKDGRLPLAYYAHDSLMS